jgi:hypothetical protein
LPYLQAKKEERNQNGNAAGKRYDIRKTHVYERS